MPRNLNGDVYGISNAPHASTQHARHGAMTFDIHSSPISTRYADVKHVKQQISLPASLSDRFRGKTIAVTGYEVSYVFDGKEASERTVPWAWLYNHHHKMHINKEYFSEGNGDETFASFKGYPHGTAQLVHSPTTINVELMVIDIRNREPPHVNFSAYIVPGLLPHGLPPAHSFFTPLFECPCTTRTLPLQTFRNRGKGCPRRLRGNTACYQTTYRGGGLCCKDKVILLDKDQEQPDLSMTFRLKARFWYEEFFQFPKPTHSHLLRVFLSVEELAYEYDVPACGHGKAPQDCTYKTIAEYSLSRQLRHQSEAVLLPTDSTTFELAYAAPHCHAPSCLSMELFHEDRLLCSGRPKYGADTGDNYLIRIDPCMWGNEYGLPPRIVLPLNATLRLVKLNNNTQPHTAEMASFQMRAVVPGAMPRTIPVTAA